MLTRSIFGLDAHRLSTGGPERLEFWPDTTGFPTGLTVRPVRPVRPVSQGRQSRPVSQGKSGQSVKTSQGQARLITGTHGQARLITGTHGQARLGTG